VAQHRHLTKDVAQLLAIYEELIFVYKGWDKRERQEHFRIRGGQRFSTPLWEQLDALLEAAEQQKWKCLHKGYCDAENGWHYKRDRRGRNNDD